MAERSSLQRRVDLILNYAYSRTSLVYGGVMLLLVVLICSTFVAETYPLPAKVMGSLLLLDLCITIVFLADYLVRWWAKGWSLRYLFTPLALVDFLSVLPLFIPANNWRFLRVLRLFRVLRLARFLQRRKSFFPGVTEYHMRQAQILFSAFCILFIYAGLMHEVDHGEQIKTFFDAWYFAVVSLTTVGFGDITPQTVAAKVISVIMILTGIILIPWQLASFGKFLMEQSTHIFSQCEGCGLERHEPDARFCKRCGQRLPKLTK